MESQSDIPAVHAAPTDLNFGRLVRVIHRVHGELAAQASRAVNVSLTLRNWIIGFHVEEYERGGVDRADYGDKLMDRLAKNLTQLGIPRCDRREIYRYRQFYLSYPQIVEAVPPQLQSLLGSTRVGDPVPPTVEATPQFRTDGKTLISRLAFTHTPAPEQREDFDKAAEYDNYKQLAGNLTLLEKPINASIGRDYFETKKNEYRRSGLFMTKSLAESQSVGANTGFSKAATLLMQHSIWNSSAIENRQQDLKKLALKLWAFDQRVAV